MTKKEYMTVRGERMEIVRYLGAGTVELMDSRGRYYRVSGLPMMKNPAPRIGTRKPLRRSQVTGKAPSRRLVARRRKNARKGFFPNPKVRHAGTGRKRVTRMTTHKEFVVQTANDESGWEHRATYSTRFYADAKGQAVNAARILARIEKVKARVVSL